MKLKVSCCDFFNLRSHMRAAKKTSWQTFKKVEEKKKIPRNALHEEMCDI